MRRLPAAMALALMLAGIAAQAREVWKGNLPDRYIDRFIQFYKQDPGAFERWGGSLSQVSSKQLHRIIVSLDTTHFTYLYPMVMHGWQMPGEEGQKLDDLSLMAVRGGKMIPIPFQFDEYDKSGLIWIKGYNDAAPEGKPGVLDDFDELVFMFRDGGEQRYNPARNGKIQGTILREIRLDSPRGDPRYVYLVKGNSSRSDADYVHADLKKGEIRTTVVDLKFDPDNFLRVKSAGPLLGPHAGQDIYDNSWVDISTGILNKHLRVGLDSKDNIRVMPIAVKDGPVRVDMLLKTRIWYMYLPTFFSRKFNINFYEQAVRIPSRFAIDSMRTLKYFMLFLRDPKIEFLMDFHNLNGAQVTFQSVYDHGKMGYVDGKMSPFEKKMANTRLPGDWLFMDSNQGWQMFFSNHLPVVPHGLFDAFLKGMKMHMVYEDDKTSKKSWEHFPGATPRIGFVSEGLPRTAVDLMNAVPKLHYGKMATLGDAIVALGQAGLQGELKKYDEIADRVLARLKKEGRITTPEQLADAFIADLNRMNFRGISHDDFDGLVHDAIVQVVKDPAKVDHGAVLRRMAKLARERHINIHDLRYATMDNTLWFPDWVGPGGPKDFHWQVTHPPRATVRHWVAPGD